MKRQRNISQIKDQIKTLEKDKMEKSNLSEAEFKTLVIRMLKELSEDLSSMKKKKRRIHQLIHRTIYRESTVEWMKPRIRSMIFNIRKQKTNMQNNKKKTESKKMRII